MVNKKEGSISYVLVTDVTDNGKLYYYQGYFLNGRPVNGNEYTEAMKIPFKDEAQFICNLINMQPTPFKYHVEEHAYC